LLYGSETWTIKARDARRITAAEMKYVRRTAGYIWTDYKTNAQTANELKILAQFGVKILFEALTTEISARHFRTLLLKFLYRVTEQT
jgi:hypothetical protein